MSELNPLTPGNWYYHIGSIWVDPIDKEAKHRVCIGSVNHRNEEMTANGKIMAASPMMYEALNHLIEVIEKKGFRAEIENAINIGKTAIKKATS